MVKYQIQFKPISPFTNKPVTNDSTYSGGNTAAKSTTDGNCILMFGRTDYTNPYFNTVKDLAQIPHAVWAVYGEYTSVKEAMVIAKPIISKYGIENVQICKIAPSSIQIVFEED